MNTSNSATTASSIPARLRNSSSTDRKSTRLNSSHVNISYAVFCLNNKTEAVRHYRLAIDHLVDLSLYATTYDCVNLDNLLERFGECTLVQGIYVFFFNDTATTEIYTLSLHDALPI